MYPEIEPFQQCDLQVDETHTVYIEECGNPNGVPVLVLHGGPGGGCSPRLRRFFDPAYWRIILFDQRGAGRSRPYAHLDGNNLASLLGDIEKIRTHLSIDRWALFGGSWGSTLALHYALASSDAVLGMVLRGIFLARDEDLDWLYRAGGAAAMKPDAWQAFLKPLSSSGRKDPLQAYYQELLPDTERARLCALAWSAWEAQCATLTPDLAVEAGFAKAAWALARIEAHFFAGGGMAGAAPILPRMDNLADIPGYLVHGRYDLVCKPEQAWALHQHWRSSELTWVDAAGHSAMEPAISTALVESVNALRLRLGGVA
ncbi:MAG: prolyl aminopeptidase [Gammaproteobacteria bacterium]|jgi:proline iminopeptidase|nr:prolyl aminopeptidase [Gammaproteobacteria bacterium]MBQ0773409.1 prolyl aminopeptidase [Gammaproteobacteria bacterium]